MLVFGELPELLLFWELPVFKKKWVTFRYHGNEKWIMRLNEIQKRIHKNDASEQYFGGLAALLILKFKQKLAPHKSGFSCLAENTKPTAIFRRSVSAILKSQLILLSHDIMNRGTSILLAVRSVRNISSPILCTEVSLFFPLFSFLFFLWRWKMEEKDVKMLSVTAYQS